MIDALWQEYMFKLEPPPNEGSYDTNYSIGKTMNKKPAGCCLQEDGKDLVQPTEDGHGRDKVVKKVQQARLARLVRLKVLHWLASRAIACLSTRMWSEPHTTRPRDKVRPPVATSSRIRLPSV